jgi:hypothetical protein
MAGREQKVKERKRKELLEKGYVKCYYCKELVKPKAMRCPHCGKWYSSGKQALAFVVVIIVALSALGGYFYMTGGTTEPAPSTLPAVLSNTPSGTAVTTTSKLTASFNKEMDKDSVESAFSISPYVPGTFSWSGRTVTFIPSGELAAGTSYTATIGAGALDKYGNGLDCGTYQWYFTTVGGTTTRREIGTGENEFWTGTITHPSWVTSDVQSKPLLILTHSEGCAPCITMTGILESIRSEYPTELTYYDILSGVDEPEATETFNAYDPDGQEHYIPLTIVITKGPNNSIIWHSWEGVIDEQTLTSWLDDAISYHQEN